MARIVIAEDQAHIRHLLVMWMTRHGHEVVEAATGREALEHLRCEPIDLLITDVNMPDMNGIELTHAALAECPKLLRIFVVTARCDQREILEQLSDPRVQVYPKPFSPSQLLRGVTATVRARDGGATAADASVCDPVGRGREEDAS